MSRVCPLCGVDKSILWCDGNVGRKLSTRNLSYNAPSDLTPNVVRCASCGFLFVPHIPQNIDELYAEVNDPEYEKTLDFRKETFRRFLAEKESYVSTKGSLLDIGCYTGLFLEVAQDGGYIVEGVEPCIWARRKAKAKGFTVFSGTLDNMKKKKYYDCITMWDVIEHVKDPVSFVLAAWDHLIEGGCLIMTTPDAGSLLMRLLGRYHWLVSPWHISYFNQKTLKKLLELLPNHQHIIKAAPAYKTYLSLGFKKFEKIPALGKLVVIGEYIPRCMDIPLTLKAALFAIAIKES